MTTEDIGRVIRGAFAGVTLGDGYDLWWGQVLDDWSAPESVADYEANHAGREERLDWSRIPAADLNRCDSSLSFFDAEGMRFHLPAFILADLRGEYEGISLLYTLVSHYHDDYTLKRLSLLNIPQRMAIRAFLLFVKDDILGGGTQWCEPDLPLIEKALEEYWVECHA